MTRNSIESATKFRRIASWWPVALGLVAIALLYGLTLREGHAWGGDNAMYALHARNIAAGLDYADTGYVHNEASGRLPKSYPPIFPLLLAPWVSVFGIAWTPLKGVTLACFVAALGLLVSAERRDSSRVESAALLALVGLNPILWDFKDSVLSEFPFLMFLCASLWVAQRARISAETNPRANGWGIALGLCIYLAYGTRSVGILLLPALVAADFFVDGRLGRRTALAALVFAPLAIVQNTLLHSEAGHLVYKLANLQPSLPLENLLVRYPRLFHDFWRSAEPVEFLGVGLAIVAALILVAGLVERGRRRELDLLDWYVLGSLGFYLAIRLTDMTPPQRYWIPLFPLFVVQILRAIRGLERSPSAWGRPRLIPGLMGGFVAMALLAYASQISGLERGAIARGITGTDARELYEFIRTRTDPDDTLIFFEPRVLTLYTGRKASELRVGGDRNEWMRYANSIDARYWVRPGGLPESYRNSLSMVFSNDTFSVFRFDQYR